ncbi:MAG: hypothetical protein JW874_07650 [Spirochaetales bacterium]|nr:hypothetical protein [Spirochaetales bacterium]
MNDHREDDPLLAEIPDELHDWYYNEIDSLLAESRRAVSKEAHPFAAERKGYLLPLVLNLSIAFFLVIALVTIFTVLDRQEKDILSNYTYYFTIEGRILAEYRQETEKKLAALNNQIVDVEYRLRDVTEEKDRLLSEMDARINEEKVRLNTEMRTALDEERHRLQGLGLAAAEIESRIRQFEAARIKEAKEYQVILEAQFRFEYEKKEKDMKVRLAEYEQILAVNLEEKTRLETELEQTNAKIRDLAGQSDKKIPAAGTATAGDTVTAAGPTPAAGGLRDTADVGIVTDQINSMYREINMAVAAADYTAALQAIRDLTEYLRLEKISALSTVRQRSEGDRQAVNSLQTLIAQLQDKALQPVSVSDRGPALPAEVLFSAEKLDKLREKIREAEISSRKYFHSIKGTAEKNDLVAQLEVKLAVKEILTSEPVVSQHPDLAAKLEEYYAVLGQDRQTAGQLIALRNIVDLFEQLEKPGSALPAGWKKIDNEEIRYSLLQVIRELGRLLD